MTFVIFGLTLAALIWVGWRYNVRQYRRAVVTDTVRMTALTVRNLLRENPDSTDQQLCDAVVSLDKVSVVQLWYDSGGRVADVWGTPLAIDFALKQSTGQVTCRSAGPDRMVGTADDIVFTTEQ
jgi:hypothetical protein